MRYCSRAGRGELIGLVLRSWELPSARLLDLAAEELTARSSARSIQVAWRDFLGALGWLRSALTTLLRVHLQACSLLPLGRSCFKRAFGSKGGFLPSPSRSRRPTRSPGPSTLLSHCAEPPLDATETRPRNTPLKVRSARPSTSNLQFPAAKPTHQQAFHSTQKPKRTL